MGSLDYHRTVIGYHGCDIETVRSVLDGGSLLESEKKYDWLGRGVYFWEHGPKRALQWAKERKGRGDGIVKTPAVLGAYIHLGKCFDLLDTENTQLLSDLYPVFEEFSQHEKLKLPENKSTEEDFKNDTALRFLDCAVLNWSLKQLEGIGEQYQTVRGAFVEGKPCFKGARIHMKTHVQIAVRDPRCIIGFFKPAH